MLNQAEEDTLELIGLVMSGFGRMAKLAREENPNLEKYDGDNNELVYHIHALQNWVLANAASRAEPTKYRPFGCKFKDYSRCQSTETT